MILAGIVPESKRELVMGLECVSGWIECHPGTASWVQALGAIAALGIAIWIASSQRRAQLKADKAKAQLTVEILKSLASRAARAVVFKSTERISLEGNLNLIRGLSISLDQLDLTSLPRPELLDPLCTLRDALRALEAGMREAQRQQYLDTWLTTQTACLWVALVISSAKQISEIE